MLLFIYGLDLLSAHQILGALFVKHLQKANSVSNYVAVAKQTSKRAKIGGEKESRDPEHEIHRLRGRTRRSAAEPHDRNGAAQR
jgi:hypothetical protein